MSTFDDTGSLTLPVWNHPTGIAGGPVPQVTACANSGNIAVTYVRLHHT